MTQTFIKGKDESLENSIDYFQNQLKKLGFNIEIASQLNPVKNVYSVHIKDQDCPQCFTNGKGASEKAALASALGEYFERLSTNYFWTDFYLGENIANSDFVHYPNEKWFKSDKKNTIPKGLLDDFWFDFLEDMTYDDLIDLQSSNKERGIVALPYTRLSDNETVYVPQAIINNLFVSNGMSAGNSLFEARVQGLSEILERFVKHQILQNSYTLPQIPQDVIASYPRIAAAIEELEQEGFAITCFDASLGGVYPVICVVLFNRENSGAFASFGAHPSFEVAFERTVTELLQGRSLKDLDIFPSPSFDLDGVADFSNLETHFIDSSGQLHWKLFKKDSDFSFTHWDFSGTTEQEYHHLISIFKDLEQELYVMDYNHLGVYACRILAPSMSNIYPADDLEFGNNNEGLSWKEDFYTLATFDKDEDYYAQLLEKLDEYGIDDFTRVREFLGLVAEPQSALSTLRIGELKAMLSIAIGDFENALDWANWTLDMNASVFSKERQNLYRCLIASLELYLQNEDDLDETYQYQLVFNRMYGVETCEKVWNALDGDNPFFDLEVISSDLSNMKAHQKLLEAYLKVQKAKLANS